MFDKTFSNGKIRYVTIVDLAEMIKLGIQTLIPLRKVHIALFSSGVRLKHAVGRVYFPLASGTG